MKALERTARANKVPRPNKNAKRAKRDHKPYGVYQIFAKRTSTKRPAVFKYGITRVGARRPQSQKSTCERHFRRECGWVWMRRYVGGWYRARQIEMGHTAAYAATHKGKFPPGMPRGL